MKTAVTTFFPWGRRRPIDRLLRPQWHQLSRHRQRDRHIGLDIPLYLLRRRLFLLALALTLALMTWANGSALASHTAYAASLIGYGSSPSTGHTLSTTASGVPAGTLVHAKSCEQAPPQSVKDRATYTPAELARYGLPPRFPGESFAKWAKIVRSAGKRVCDYVAGTSRFGESNSWNWDGNVADQATSGQIYTETDLDYFVSCINSSPPPDGNDAVYGAWVGLGGAVGSNRVLVQTGTAGWQTFNTQTQQWQRSYAAFVEDTWNDPGPYYPVFNPAVSCGDHFYAKAYDSGSQGCVYIQRIRDGQNYGKCYGNGSKSDEQSAEAIVEYNYSEPDFANFGSETFYGVGITDSCNCSYNGYHSMGYLPHDYHNLFECQPIADYPICLRYGDQLASTGPIQNDPGDVPYDQYAVNWVNYK